MGDVVNLNRFRKRKARDEKSRRAAENRVRHGRTKAEREAGRTANERLERTVDGARRDPQPPWEQPAPSEDEEARWHGWLGRMTPAARRDYLLRLRPIPAPWGDGVRALFLAAGATEAECEAEFKPEGDGHGAPS